MRRLKVQESKNALFWFALVTGIIIVLMMAVKFFFPEARVPEDLKIFYVVILICYVVVKEVSRWVGDEPAAKLGEYLVFLWAGSFALMHVLEFSLKLFIINQKMFVTPSEMLRPAIEVVIIFTASEVSKKIYRSKK